MLVYMANQEGRSIGLMAKALTYKLQEMQLDTFEANRLIGCGMMIGITRKQQLFCTI